MCNNDRDSTQDTSQRVQKRKQNRTALNDITVPLQNNQQELSSSDSSAIGNQGVMCEHRLERTC